MGVKQHTLRSPGEFSSVIDNTELARKTSAQIGPTIIGTTVRGRTLVPTRVYNKQESVEVFGRPNDGKQNGDVWRDNIPKSPTYGSYGAHAYLTNSFPVNVIKVLGTNHPKRSSTAVEAGWDLKGTDQGSGGTIIDPTDSTIFNGGAFGLFIADLPVQGDLAYSVATFEITTPVAGDVLNLTLFSPSDSVTYNLSTTVKLSPTVTIVGNQVAEMINSEAGINFKAFFDGASTVVIMPIKEVGVDGDSCTLVFALVGTGTYTPVTFTNGGDIRASFTAVIGEDGLTGTDLITINDSVTTTLQIADSSTPDYTIVTVMPSSYPLGSTAGIEAIGNLIVTDINEQASEHFTASFDGTDTITIYPKKEIGLTGNSCIVNYVVTDVASDSQLQFVASTNNSTFTDINIETAQLASIFYVDDGNIELKGVPLNSTETEKVTNGQWLQSNTDDYGFKVVVTNKEEEVKEFDFNFNSNSKKFIRRVLNTNPIKTNPTLMTASAKESFWVGETFEDSLYNNLTEIHAQGKQIGIIVPLENTNSSITKANNLVEAQHSKSGWVVGQHKETFNTFIPNFITKEYNTAKLFRFVSLGMGEEVQKNIKLSITDIKPPYGSNLYGRFTVIIRKLNDIDGKLEIVENFTDCDLNPASENYIGYKIGTEYLGWDYLSNSYLRYGSYPNNSAYIRIEIAQEIENGAADPDLVPFGFYTEPVFLDVKSITNTNLVDEYGNNNQMVCGNTEFFNDPYSQTPSIPDLGLVDNYSGTLKSVLKFPSARLKQTTTDTTLTNTSDYFWGAEFRQTLDKQFASQEFKDLTKHKPVGVNSYDADLVYTKFGELFTLDNVEWEIDTSTGLPSTVHAKYNPIGRRTGTSISAQETYEQTLYNGFNKFSMFLYGGSDGVDIKEANPFRNTLLKNADEYSHYAFNSLKRALHSVKDKEVIETNLITMPGVTNTSLTDLMMQIAAERGDAMAIIDLEGDYIPTSEGVYSPEIQRPKVSETITNLRQRNIDNYHACALFPYLIGRDPYTNVLIDVPASLAFIGVFANTQRINTLFYPPAGNKRASLALKQACGLPIVSSKLRLTQTDRDELFEVGINPVKTSLSDGAVIYGDKTLKIIDQSKATVSALSEIGVVRMLLSVTNSISKIAAQLNFEYNTQELWQDFKFQAETILTSIKADLGLSEYRVILDETTTTDLLIDNNILYAKIYLKPNRSIRWIVVDYSLENSSANLSSITEG